MYVLLNAEREINRAAGDKFLARTGHPSSHLNQCQLEHDNWPCQEVILRGKGGRGASLLPDE